MKPLAGTIAATTDIGRVRLVNEDQAAALRGKHNEILIGVLDGMGGSNKGEYASNLAREILFSAFSKKPPTICPLATKFWMNHVANAANRAVYKYAEGNPEYKGMGTTFCAALISSGKIVVANVGDSRCYSYSNGELKRLTEDQTYVAYLLRTGKISKEEASTHPDRHILMNALGIYPSLSITFNVYKNNVDSLVCCTDGLYNSLGESEIEAVMAMDLSTEEKASMLCKLACDAGGTDNVGVSIWEAGRD